MQDHGKQNGVSIKQLERTVIRRRGRAASAPFHYALAARWTAQRAAAQLRRYASASKSRNCCCPLRRSSAFNFVGASVSAFRASGRVAIGRGSAARSSSLG
jgi:hypothetical protein